MGHHRFSVASIVVVIIIIKKSSTNHNRSQHLKCLAPIHKTWKALTIQAHVFSKGLWQNNIVALFNEVAHGPSIPIDVPTGKALIGHVEEHQQISFLSKVKIQVMFTNSYKNRWIFSNILIPTLYFHKFKSLHLDHISHLFPLLCPWVYSSGVVSTCMKDNHTLLWDFLRDINTQKTQQNSLFNQITFKGLQSNGQYGQKLHLYHSHSWNLCGAYTNFTAFLVSILNK